VCIVHTTFCTHSLHLSRIWDSRVGLTVLFDQCSMLLGKCICQLQIMYQASGALHPESRPTLGLCLSTPMGNFPNPQWQSVPTVPTNLGYVYGMCQVYKLRSVLYIFFLVSFYILGQSRRIKNKQLRLK